MKFVNRELQDTDNLKLVDKDEKSTIKLINKEEEASFSNEKAVKPEDTTNAIKSNPDPKTVIKGE